MCLDKNDPIPEHSWHQLFCGAGIQVSFLLRHKLAEEAHYHQCHEHHYFQERPEVDSWYKNQTLCKIPKKHCTIFQVWLSIVGIVISEIQTGNRWHAYKKMMKPFEMSEDSTIKKSKRIQYKVFERPS